MLKLFTFFNEEMNESESVTLFKQNMEDGEFLVFPYQPGMAVPAKGTLLFSDVQSELSYWEEHGGCAVGYEHDGITLSAKEIVTDIEELYPEDVEDLADYAMEKTHFSFFHGDFDFYRLGYEDYKTLYNKQNEEPFLLPSSYKNLTEPELHLRYQKDAELSRMTPLYTVYGFALADHSEIIGQIAIEPSELTDRAHNISYYIKPAYRGKGIMTNALRAYLERMNGRLNGMPLLAIVSRQNPASAAVAKANGFSILSADSQILEKRPEGFFTFIY